MSKPNKQVRRLLAHLRRRNGWAEARDPRAARLFEAARRRVKQELVSC